MNTKHTPGPWAMSRDAVPEGHTQITIYAEVSGERVATAFLAEENARPIAAAPDLLAALDEIERHADEAARLGVKRCAAIRDCARARYFRAWLAYIIGDFLEYRMKCPTFAAALDWLLWRKWGRWL